MKILTFNKCTQHFKSFLEILFLCQPGDPKSVKLVSIGGNKVIRGGNGIVDGPVNDANCSAAMEIVTRRRYGNLEDANARCVIYAKPSSATCFLYSSHQ